MRCMEDYKDNCENTFLFFTCAVDVSQCLFEQSVTIQKKLDCFFCIPKYLTMGAAIFSRTVGLPIWT